MSIARSLTFVLTLLLPTLAVASPPELDLHWTPSMTSGERRELLERPRFAAGEPMLVGGLIAAGAGIGMLVAGLATKTPELTAAGAVAWPVGATVHFVGLGLFLSETRPYYRDLKETSAPGLSSP
ncbi:MAG: hypothetical protein KDA24_24565 [Deltaproteobacteria bacterium]|nr:hypothetical protein [Deltaproteobacteria bacterium]